MTPSKNTSYIDFEKNGYVLISDTFNDKDLSNIKKIIENVPFEVFDNKLLPDSKYLILQNMNWIKKLEAVLIKGRLEKVAKDLFEQEVKIDGLYLTKYLPKYLPNSGHHLQWHTDKITPERLAAFNICFNFWGERDGALEIIDKETKEERIKYTGNKPGVIVVFRIDDKQIHRVTEPTNYPRVSMTGWFIKA